jgi:hypothetical protein
MVRATCKPNRTLPKRINSTLRATLTKRKAGAVTVAAANIDTPAAFDFAIVVSV